MKRFLLLLLVIPIPAISGWTGISAFLGQGETNWLVGDNSYIADRNYYGLKVEEKSLSNLTLGLLAGKYSLRLKDENSLQKFTGEFLQAYLRWPIPLNTVLTLHNSLGYQYNVGRNYTDQDATAISWNDMKFSFGVGATFDQINIRAFMAHQGISGDITYKSVNPLIELKSNQSYGLVIGYELQPTSFIRMRLTSGNTESIMVSFVREIL